MNRKILAALLATALTAGASAAKADLIANGGFETGTFSGWTQGGNTGSTFVDSGPNVPHSGDFAAQLGPVGSDGTLSQSFSATGTGTYTLSFWHKYDSAAGPVGDFSASLDSTVLYSQASASPPAPQVWTQYTFSFMPSAGSHTITFAFRQDPSYQGLDDVSLNGPLSQVPEPASLAIMALGLAGIRLRRR